MKWIAPLVTSVILAAFLVGVWALVGLKPDWVMVGSAYVCAYMACWLSHGRRA